MSKWKKRKGLIIAAAVTVFLLLAISLARSFVLKKIGEQLEKSFEIGQIKLSYVPPSLEIKELRSRSSNPAISLESLKVSISIFSLFSKEKRVSAEIERPEVIYNSRIKQVKTEGGSSRPLNLTLNLPLLIEDGYIHHGQFSVSISQGDFHFKDVSAFFRLEAGRLNLLIHSEDMSMRPFSAKWPVSGQLESLVNIRGKTINIERLVFQGEDSALRASGQIKPGSATKVNFKTLFNFDTAFIMSTFNLPFQWEGKATGEATVSNDTGPLVVQVNYKAPDLNLNQVNLGLVEGQVRVEGKKGGQVLAEIKNNNKPVEKAVISYDSRGVFGEFYGFHLDSIMKYASVPWPVASPVWGKFALSHGQLTASAEFRDRIEKEQAGGRRSFRGLVNISLNIPELDLRVESKDLTSSFGQLSINGQILIGRKLDLSIDGQFGDIKEARSFAEKILNENFGFPEIRGAGRSTITLRGDYYHPDVSLNFSCSPAGFERFNVTTARGEVEVKAGQVTGKVYAVDKMFQGEINFKSNNAGTDVKISLERGVLENILPLLAVNFPLKGSTSGEFVYKTEGQKVEFRGDFSASELYLLSTRMEEVNGELRWRENRIEFPRLAFHLNQGVVSGRMALGLADNSYDFDLTADGLELSPFSTSFAGRMETVLKGQGIFGQDRLPGHFTVQEATIYFIKAASVKGDFSLNFLDNNLNIEARGQLLPGDNNYELKLDIPFDRDFIRGEVRGELSRLDFLLPWKGANGSISCLLSFEGPLASPALSGAVEVKGSVLPIPGFAHALNDFSGLAFVKGNQISIRSFQASLGGGQLQVSGQLIFGEKGLDQANIELTGKNMQLSIFEKTRTVADGSLRFLRQGGKNILEGELFFQEVWWGRELWDKLSFSTTAYPGDDSRKAPLSDLNLNVRLRASDNVWMDNSLGRIRARLDLTISGTTLNPVLTGEINALSGTFFFQDRDFKVVKGRLSFFNPLVIDPYIDFQGETYVKDYHVVFNLTGLISNLKPEFSSSPPLPQEEILSLLALGESYQRKYTLDRTQMSTASLISSQLARGPENLLSLDSLRLDPFIMSTTSEVTARLTVGKRLSKNFSIVYSTNLATQREEIVRIEWELERGLSLVAIRNEIGRISIDFKIRKRF
ncbi:MAG: translocation/assembly module TamB domain-containing protein [Acidobacteriota bacterium]|nr:translocation/assembly module TamB domain-containing protein [Acidobacteriota bacterium]